MERSSISAIQIRDLNDIKSISDHCFGKNYLTLHQLNKMLLREAFHAKIVVNQVLIGFCLAQKIDAEELKAKYKIQEADSPGSGLIKTLAIAPDYQRQGYGTLLLKHVIHKMEAQGNIKVIYYPSWMESKCEGFSKSIKKEGFKELDILKKYWSAHSLANNYSCVTCGNPPCQCSMQLYRKSTRF